MWVALKSAALGGRTVVITDHPASVPTRYRAAVRFTPEEVAQLQGSTKAELATVYEAKRRFPGAVVEHSQRKKVEWPT